MKTQTPAFIAHNLFGVWGAFFGGGVFFLRHRPLAFAQPGNSFHKREVMKYRATTQKHIINRSSVMSASS